MLGGRMEVRSGLVEMSFEESDGSKRRLREL
jgi:hypothetical protein